MPISIDLFNLVIEKAAVQERYPGGQERFRTDIDFDPARWADQEDNELFSIGAMDAVVVMDHLRTLRNKGLRYDPDEPSTNDLVIISRYGGPGDRPLWLRCNSFYAWHATCDPALQDKAESIMKLSVEEFDRMQQSGELPVGTLV